MGSAIGKQAVVPASTPIDPNAPKPAQNPPPPPPVPDPAAAYAYPSAAQASYAQPAYGQSPYGQPPGYGQPPAYGQSPAYPAQQPAYPYAAPAQQPYGYAPAYGYPAYAQPMYPAVAQPDHTNTTFAGVMWILLFIRDILMFIAVLVLATFLTFLTLGLGAPLLLLVIFPLIGVIGSLMAMVSDFQRKNHTMGTVGGILAIVGSAFPGVLFGIGVIGIALGVIGLALHLNGKKEFAA